MSLVEEESTESDFSESQSQDTSESESQSESESESSSPSESYSELGEGDEKIRAQAERNKPQVVPSIVTSRSASTSQRQTQSSSTLSNSAMDSQSDNSSEIMVESESESSSTLESSSDESMVESELEPSSTSESASTERSVSPSQSGARMGGTHVRSKTRNLPAILDRPPKSSDNNQAKRSSQQLVLASNQGPLVGVPLRRAQSLTTTVSSLSCSQLTKRIYDHNTAEEDLFTIAPINIGTRRKRKGQEYDILHELGAKVDKTLTITKSGLNRKTVRELVAMGEIVGQSTEILDAVESTHSNAHASHQLLYGFEALLGALLQLSDELELLSTLGGTDDGQSTAVASEALNAVLSHAPTADHVFVSLRPIIQRYLEEDPIDEMDHLLGRAQKLVGLLCDLTYRVWQRQEWNDRAETAYVTLLEMLERTAQEIICLFEGQSVPKYELSGSLRRAWTATGHVEALKTLFMKNDTLLFRQVCYEVLKLTDQWCPNIQELCLVCDVANSVKDDDVDVHYRQFAPKPQWALQVLDKINGEPLPRSLTMASILRRILPQHALTDVGVLGHSSYSQSSAFSPRGAMGSKGVIVAISSVSEDLNDPLAMGMTGVGKTTMAAMVALHDDVRSYFKDGVAFAHVGMDKLDYLRYTHCLRDIVAQVGYSGMPIFADLVNIPGEPSSKRKRREAGFMLHARDTIANIMETRNVLIILDDVYFESDLQWFQFMPQIYQSTQTSKKKLDTHSPCILLTTKIRDLLPFADTVEIDLLEEVDAIKLMVTESGQPPNHVIASSREAQEVVRECANHPLAVKSVGRWLSLKHAAAGVISSVEEIHESVARPMRPILNVPDQGTDKMYEIMEMSFSPSVNGKSTNILKLCFAAFVQVFCYDKYSFQHQKYSWAPSMVPRSIAVLLFEALLEMEGESLFPVGSPFYSRRKDAVILIPEAFVAVGVLKAVTTYDADDDLPSKRSLESNDEEIFLQIMHSIQHEYGEYLSSEANDMKVLTSNSECKWNRAFVEAYMLQYQDWDTTRPDAARDYGLELIISHMLRAEMFREAAELLADERFVRCRIFAFGTEKATRRHIKDCESLHSNIITLIERAMMDTDPRNILIRAYATLGNHLITPTSGSNTKDPVVFCVDAGRAQYEIGFSLSERQCWKAAITHWESSQELLLSSLGMTEFVAAILFNVGVVYCEMNQFEQSLASLQQCLHARGILHGVEHILFAHTVQKIGDVFLAMSDFTEAMNSYKWALDIMQLDVTLNCVDIGEILDSIGNIHYNIGEVTEALKIFQVALNSKKVELGDDHPELAATYHHIGNCLTDQDRADDAISYFEEVIRLKKLDPDLGAEGDSDVLAIKGVLNTLTGQKEEGLRYYERSLEILTRKVPHRKEKIARLLHVIGCVYLTMGEYKKAMKIFVASLKARRAGVGFVHVDVVSTLFNIAFLHQSNKHPEKAFKCLEQALKILQVRLPDSEKVALTHAKIGLLAKAMGWSKKAEISFEEALRIRRSIFGDENEAVADVLVEMGDLMDDLGEYGEAMENYVTALNIRRKLLGDHEAVAANLYSIGYTLHNQGESLRALKHLEESLAIRKARLGNNAMEVGDTLNMMGSIEAKRGKLDHALELLSKALRIRKANNNDVKISETLKNIGNVQREKRQYELAVECYENCLRLRRNKLGDDHDKVADALIAIGNVQNDMNNIDKATRSYQEALAILSMAGREGDERVADVLQYMGGMEFRCGDLDRARLFLEEFVRIRRQGKIDGEFVNALITIGKIHMIHGEEGAAKERWSKANEVFQALGLASENPKIARMLDTLLLGDRDKGASRKKPTTVDNSPISVLMTMGGSFVDILMLSLTQEKSNLIV